MKFAVGVMLTSFGMFWGAEGAGASWPGGDAALLAIVPLRAGGRGGDGVGAAAPRVGSGRRQATPSPGGGGPRRRPAERMSRVEAFGVGVWEFIVGDDWRIAVGVVAALGLTALIARAGSAAWWVMPVAVLALLTLSLRRAARAAARKR